MVCPINTYEESLRNSDVPAHNHEALAHYIANGRPTGSFLRAVLNNDLREAFGRADRVNTEYLRFTVEWLYNNAPCECWGSPERVDAWVAHQGLSGLYAQDNKEMNHGR